MIPALLAHPLDKLPEHCHFMPGVPVKPMLAKATNAVSEVIDKFQDSEFTCEYKYDGERAQLHVLDNGSVMIFSRWARGREGRGASYHWVFSGQLGQLGISILISGTLRITLASTRTLCRGCTRR